MSEFSSRLKKLRLEKKMTQEELGRHVNVTKVSISGYENETRTPDLETLQKLADVLDVSADYLLGRDVVLEEPLSEDDEKIMKTFVEDIDSMPMEKLLKKYALEYHDISFTDDEARLAIEIIKANRKINKK